MLYVHVHLQMPVLVPVPVPAPVSVPVYVPVSVPVCVCVHMCTCVHVCSPALLVVSALHNKKLLKMKIIVTVFTRLHDHPLNVQQIQLHCHQQVYQAKAYF